MSGKYKAYEEYKDSGLSGWGIYHHDWKNESRF